MFPACADCSHVNDVATVLLGKSVDFDHSVVFEVKLAYN